MITTQSRPRPEAFPLAPRTNITPKRGVHLKPGDVVLFANGTAYRILIIAEGRPLTMTGTWEIVDSPRARILTRRDWRIVPFELWRIAWYTTRNQGGPA